MCLVLLMLPACSHTKGLQHLHAFPPHTPAGPGLLHHVEKL